MGRAAGAAYALPVAMVLGSAAGYGLDQWLGTLPLGLILGILLGFAGGLYNLYQALVKSDEP